MTGSPASSRPIHANRKLASFKLSRHPVAVDSFIHSPVHCMKLMSPGDHLMQPIAVGTFSQPVLPSRQDFAACPATMDQIRSNDRRRIASERMSIPLLFSSRRNPFRQKGCTSGKNGSKSQELRPKASLQFTDQNWHTYSIVISSISKSG